MASIKKVATIVADIANASTEQSSGIEQVNKALSQMDEVTQQNSALVEENAATAKTLEHQARSMDQRVAAFRLRGAAAGDAGVVEPPLARLRAPRPKDAQTRRGEGQAHLKPNPSPNPAPMPQPKLMPPAPTGRGPKRVVAGGPVGRMQTALAAAVNADAGLAGVLTNGVGCTTHAGRTSGE